MGPSGRVYAVDVEPKILDALRERLAAAKVRNVTPVLAPRRRRAAPAGACDVILIVDTYHHFPERPAYLRRLSAALKPGAHIVNVDYHKRPTPVGPPMDHRLSRETFIEEAKAAGLAVMSEPQILPYQYVVVLRPAAKAN